MQYKIIILSVIIALAIIPTCVMMIIAIKDLAIKRHWIVMSVLMMLAIAFSRIVEAKAGNFVAGLIFGLGVLVIGFMPVVYIDSLKKKNHIAYKGVRKKIGDWLDQPIRTLFSANG